jgi:hypothetical protein
LLWTGCLTGQERACQLPNHCSYEVEHRPSKLMKKRTDRSLPLTKTGLLAGLAVVVLGILVTVWLLTRGPGPPGYRPDTTAATTQAIKFALAEVQRASNTFSGGGRGTKYLGDRRYRVQLQLTVEDTSGAMVTNDFDCIVRDVDGERWRLESIAIKLH